MQPSTFWVPKKTYDSWLPEGFVFVTGPDNEIYIVPEFMVPALDQNYNAKQKKLELRASSAPGSVSHLFYNSTVTFRHVCRILKHPALPENFLTSGITGEPPALALYRFLYTLEGSSKHYSTF